MILRLISYLTGRKIVLLEDFEGQVYKTLELKGRSFGKKRAHVYWFTGVGSVILNDDGTTSGSSSYIERWEYKYSNP